MLRLTFKPEFAISPWFVKFEAIFTGEITLDLNFKQPWAANANMWWNQHGDGVNLALGVPFLYFGLTIKYDKERNE